MNHESLKKMIKGTPIWYGITPLLFNSIDSYGYVTATHLPKDGGGETIIVPTQHYSISDRDPKVVASEFRARMEAL